MISIIKPVALLGQVMFICFLDKAYVFSSLMGGSPQEAVASQFQALE
jgi:hypothetical protein